jgi:hypothetical protein
MALNGEVHLESFEDVEAEFREVRVERADGEGRVMSAIGGLTAEVAAVRREVTEVKLALINGGVPVVRSTDDTGSHDLRQTYAKLKASAENPDSPLKPNDVRKIVKDITDEMSLKADAGTWRAIKVQIRKYAIKAFWFAVAAAAGGVGHWLTGKH